MNTTELAAQLASNPRFRSHDSRLFDELAARYGQDFTGIAYIQACLKVDQEPDAGQSAGACAHRPVYVSPEDPWTRHVACSACNQMLSARADGSWDACGEPAGARAEAYDVALERLARVLLDFTEENIADGPCAACRYPVPAHSGLFATGASERGTIGAALHRGCAADVQWAKMHPPERAS